MPIWQARAILLPMRAPLSYRDDRHFLLLLLVVVIVRLALLFTSQGHVNGDQAIVGIMAKHIVEKGVRPIFCYGAAYNGGSALTAYLATIPFALLGMSERALILIPLLFSFAALTMVYLFVRGARGRRAALFCALAYATSIGLMKWSFDARGAYMECQVLIPLAFWLLRERCLAPGAGGWKTYLLLGLICGFGFYMLEIFSAAICTVALFSLAYGKLFKYTARMSAFAVGCLLGAFPLIYFNLTHEWENLRHVAEGESIPLLVHIASAPGALWRILSSDLPRSFAYATMYGFPESTGLSSWIEYGIFLTSALIVVVARRSDLTRLVPIGRRKESPAPASIPPPIEAVLFLYIVIYLLLISMHPLSGNNARYYLFLEPAFSILIGLALAETFRADALRDRRMLLLGIALLAWTAPNRLIQLSRLAGDDLIYGSQGTSSPGLARDLIGDLEKRDIAHVVVEDYDLRWRILFLSREAIVASTFPGGWSRYPEYEDQVGRAARLGVVINDSSPFRAELSRAIVSGGLRPEEISVGDKILYAPLPQLFAR